MGSEAPGSEIESVITGAEIDLVGGSALSHCALISVRHKTLNSTSTEPRSRKGIVGRTGRE